MAAEEQSGALAAWCWGGSGLELVLLNVYGPFPLLILEQERDVFAIPGVHDLQLFGRMLT